ncbi:MAG: murein biosynthesis integral membrane protein MurJ [Parcubacteria group bacterium]|nr:murein biosynthesis integral membrane protein MurJ [Parcubacteria group bacterium]
MLKFLHHESRSVESGAYILAGTGLLGGMLGVFRNALLASRFGATQDLDIYFATFRIPDLIYNIFIFGALSAGFMPIFAKWILLGKEKAWEFVSAVIIVFVAIVGISAAVVFIFAHPLAKLLVPGFDAEAASRVAMLLRILMLQPIILAVSNVMASTLQSFRRFFVYSLAPIMYNAGVIVGIVWFGKAIGIAGVVWGVVLGALLHLLIQLPAFIALDFHFVTRVREAFQSLREMARLMLPRSMALAINQLNLVWITIIASLLPAGTLSVFNFANDLQGLPQTLLALSFATAAFPALSQLWAKAETKDFKRLFHKTLAEILLWLVPIALILFALRTPVVKLLLDYGRFDEFAQKKTADTFAIIVLGLPAQGVLLLLVRTFFAMGESRLPLFSAVFSSLLAAGVAFGASRYWESVGLALGFVAASIVQSASLLFILRRRLNGIDGRPLLRVTFRAGVLGGVAALLAWLVYVGSESLFPMETMGNILLRLALSSIPIGVVLFVGILMFKLLDIRHFGEEKT